MFGRKNDEDHPFWSVNWLQLKNSTLFLWEQTHYRAFHRPKSAIHLTVSVICSFHWCVYVCTRESCLKHSFSAHWRCVCVWVGLWMCWTNGIAAHRDCLDVLRTAAFTQHTYTSQHQHLHTLNRTTHGSLDEQAIASWYFTILSYTHLNVYTFVSSIRLQSYYCLWCVWLWTHGKTALVYCTMTCRVSKANEHAEYRNTENDGWSERIKESQETPAITIIESTKHQKPNEKKIRVHMPLIIRRREMWDSYAFVFYIFV